MLMTVQKPRLTATTISCCTEPCSASSDTYPLLRFLWRILLRHMTSVDEVPTQYQDQPGVTTALSLSDHQALRSDMLTRIPGRDGTRRAGKLSSAATMPLLHHMGVTFVSPVSSTAAGSNTPSTEK